MSKSNNIGRIVLINNNPPHSGTGNYAYLLYRYLVKLIKSRLEFISWDRELFDSTFYHLVSDVRWFYYMTKLRLLAKGLKGSFSLVHVTNAGYFASIIPYVKRKSNTLVVTVHDLISFIAPRSIGDAFIRKVFINVSQANRIIVPSENTKKDLLRFINVNPKEVKVIYYGVDHKLFRPRDKLEAKRKLKLPLNRLIVLNVGTEEPRKNIPTLLKVFKKLLNDVPDALLIRVGERTQRIERMIIELGLSSKVIYLRPTNEDLAYLYNASDIFAFPSYYEGMGLPLLEAMASGLPIVAGNRSAVPEAVGNGGILIDPFDVDGFAYWMREVLTDEELKARLSEAGYKRSLNFSWEKCAKETLEVYKEVLNEV